MTTKEQVEVVQTLVVNDKKATAPVVRVYLLSAEQKILDRLYGLTPELRANGVPDEYRMLQCELAARLFLRRGGEGEISHEENGINRQWASPDDEDILSRIVPFARV